MREQNIRCRIINSAKWVYLKDTIKPTTFLFANQSYSSIFAAASLIRPAPIELPQGRNAARVNGCSGAM